MDDVVAENLGKHKVYLFGNIDEGKALETIASLDSIEQDNSQAAFDYRAPIQLRVASGGGAFYWALAIAEHIRHMETPVHILAMGGVFSGAVLVVAAGARGHRSAFPHTRFLIHPQEVNWESFTANQHVLSQYLEDMREGMGAWAELMSEFTGTPTEVFREYEEKRKMEFFGVKEALELGIIDQIMGQPVSMEKVFGEMTPQEQEEALEFVLFYRDMELGESGEVLELGKEEQDNV